MAAIQPYDKGSMSAIEKAIRNSDLGVNPSNDGSVIRVVFPDLSEERRKEYIKVARSKAEDSRVSIRNIRRHAKDSIDKLVKGGDAGEDDGRRAERELDELTHTYIAQVDELLKHKEAETSSIGLARARRRSSAAHTAGLARTAASPGRSTPGGTCPPRSR